MALASAHQASIARAFAEIGVSGSAPRFGFDDVIERARRLAEAPFENAPRRLPKGVDGLDYDSWRDIRFKPDRATPLTSSKAFRLETFHLGFLYRRAVTVNLIREGIASPIPYSPNYFDFGRVRLDESLPADMGFAGFRLHYPLNDPHVHDEVISFLGASYFRFLGRDQKYGLSARALCVDAGTERESFPVFREFWIEASNTDGNIATIYALLDGEAVTGAYRFDVTPGQETTIDVRATLFPRRADAKFGLAPLTSMFLTGENDHRVRDGFRAELHDSDGLLIQTAAGEWIWRPLANPKATRATAFLDESNKGFGLMQRDRLFESYEDLELAYESRPSYFVEPIGDWGPGRVELIELSTEDETNDNIVASWTPAAPLKTLRPFSYAYRLTACLDLSRLSPNGRAINTFLASARALGSSEKAPLGTCRFLVDFTSVDLAYYVSDPSQVEAVASATNGQILRANVVANPHVDGLRVMLDVYVKPGQTSDLRLFLRAGARTLTETWLYLWTAPEEPSAQSHRIEPLAQNASVQEPPKMSGASTAGQAVKN